MVGTLVIAWKHRTRQSRRFGFTGCQSAGRHPQHRENFRCVYEWSAVGTCAFGSASQISRYQKTLSSRVTSPALHRFDNLGMIRSPAREQRSRRARQWPYATQGGALILGGLAESQPPCTAQSNLQPVTLRQGKPPACRLAFLPAPGFPTSGRCQDIPIPIIGILKPESNRKCLENLIRDSEGTLLQNGTPVARPPMDRCMMWGREVRP